MNQTAEKWRRGASPSRSTTVKKNYQHTHLPIACKRASLRLVLSLFLYGEEALLTLCARYQSK